MTLPDIKYRQIAYKVVLALIPAVGALVPAGVLTAGTAGLIAGVLGFLGNLLADRASTQLQKDGTLVLSGTVEKQVTDGINILAGKAGDVVGGINQINEAWANAQRAQRQTIDAVTNSPVLGPIAKQIIDQLR